MDEERHLRLIDELKSIVHDIEHGSIVAVVDLVDPIEEAIKLLKTKDKDNV